MVLILLVTVYVVLIGALPTLTGSFTADGIIGVLLGLYTCSQPAANVIDLLFFERNMLRHLPRWLVLGWVALNLLGLAAGYVAIVTGVMRFAGNVP